MARELCVTASTLGSWREEFIAAGEAGLKSPQPRPRDEEVQRLKAMIGEVTIQNELLLMRARMLEEKVNPLGWRRSSPSSAPA